MVSVPPEDAPDTDAGLCREDLEATKAELEELNAELFRSQEKLIELTAELEQANRLKELFISIIEHDLNNPLALIVGFAGILKRGIEGKNYEYLDRMERAARNMSSLIAHCRTFSMLQAGAFEQKLIELELDRILLEIIDELGPAAQEKELTIAHDCCTPGRRITALPIIKEIFLNFLDNAVKHSGNGGEIGLGIEDLGELWRVRVRDRGPGVPDKHKEAIFRRFERGGKQGVKGTGLGLAIAWHVAQLHDGSVWVEDNTPTGSCFCAELPKRPPAQPHS